MNNKLEKILKKHKYQKAIERDNLKEIKYSCEQILKRNNQLLEYLDLNDYDDMETIKIIQKDNKIIIKNLKNKLQKGKPK